MTPMQLLLLHRLGGDLQLEVLDVLAVSANYAERVIITKVSKHEMS